MSEVSPPSERAQEEEVTPQAQREVPKEWSERVKQSEREAREFWSVAQDHSWSVSGQRLRIAMLTMC
jgi:hypothetical protein